MDIFVGDLVRLFCGEEPADKFFLVIDIAKDIENEPPMYRLFCLNTGDDAGWQYEFFTVGKLYKIKKVDRSVFLK